MSISDFTSLNLTGYEHSYGFSIAESPTGNCQLFSVRYFGDIIANRDDKEVKDIIKDFKRLTSKSQMLIDVLKLYEERIDKLFDSEQILSKSHYNNGTNNKMIIYIIKI